MMLEDRNDYRIAIDRNEIDCARVFIYDLNDFVLLVLDNFCQNNPSYQLVGT